MGRHMIPMDGGWQGEQVDHEELTVGATRTLARVSSRLAKSVVVRLSHRHRQPV